MKVIPNLLDNGGQGAYNIPIIFQADAYRLKKGLLVSALNGQTVNRKES